MTKKIAVIIAACILLLTGCTEAGKVSQNIAKEADNFNVYRRVVSINTRTDKPEIIKGTDLVPAVRCKDCKFRENDDFCTGRGFPYQLVPDDGFCDKGKRTEE